MSKLAYKDEARKNRVYAEDCNYSNLDDEYYCSTPHCTAKMTLRSLEGKVNPYFSALKSHPHSDFCTIGKIEGHKSDYDLEDFSMQSLYDSIINTPVTTSTTGGGTKKKDPPTGTDRTDKINTTSKLYYFCKGHDIDYPVNEQLKVVNLIADSRTNFLFARLGFWGLRLVEASFHQYRDNKKCIYFHYPIDTTLKNQFDISVHFKNTDDYEKIKKKIFSNKETYKVAHICILGNWDKDKCEIESRKQIIVIGSE